MRVVMEVLENSSEEMKEQLHQLSCEIESVGQVLRNVASFQGMEEIVGELNRYLEEVRKEELILSQMLVGLERILEQYAGCEKKILQLYDQDIYTVYHRKMGYHKIQENRDLIRRFIR